MKNSIIRNCFVFDKFVADCFSLVTSFIVAYIIRYIIQDPIYYQAISSYYDEFSIGISAWIFFMIRADLYRHKAQLFRFDEFFTVLGVGIVATLSMFSYMSLVKETEYARLTFIYSGGIGIVFVSTSRAFLHMAHNRLRRNGFGVINVLIVGGGRSGQMLENKIRNHTEIGYRIIDALKEEFIDRSESNRESVKKSNNTNTAKKLLDATFNFIERNPVSEIIYIRSRSYKEDMMKLLYFCEDRNIRLTLVPDLFEIMTKKVDFSDLGNIPVMRLKQKATTLGYTIFKRLLDVILSSVGIILLSPFIIAVIIIIKMDSPGPAIFRQERIGKNGNPFTMYKFRSMQTYAASLPPTRADEDDPRMTRSGKYLRKFSIDELPQLLNVLKGDMMLIGPRPETALYVDQYTSWQRRRLEITPGITGLAQVNGVRGNIDSVDERVMYDIEYIENQNIILDLKILLATLLVFPFQGKAG